MPCTVVAAGNLEVETSPDYKQYRVRGWCFWTRVRHVGFAHAENRGKGASGTVPATGNGAPKRKPCCGAQAAGPWRCVVRRRGLGCGRATCNPRARQSRALRALHTLWLSAPARWRACRQASGPRHARAWGASRSPPCIAHGAQPVVGREANGFQQGADRTALGVAARASRAPAIRAGRARRRGGRAGASPCRRGRGPASAAGGPPQTLLGKMPISPADTRAEK